MRPTLLALAFVGCTRAGPPAAAPSAAAPAPAVPRPIPTPSPVLLAVDPGPGPVVVHLPAHDAHPGPEAWSEVGRPQPRDRWPSLDVDPDDAWWVLPDAGPAVRAAPVEVALAVENECGGSFAWAVTLDAPLPPGATGLAVLRGTPPASWRTSPAAPTLGADAARDALHALAEAGAAYVEVGLAPDADGWVGRVAWGLDEDDEHGIPRSRVIDARVTADGHVLLVDDHVEHTLTGVALPYAARDLDGDGRTEVLLSNGCVETAVGPAGEVAANASRCCGC